MCLQIAEDYACADVILRLPGHAPMPAFRESEDVPLVVRHARRTRQQVGLSLTANWCKLQGLCNDDGQLEHEATSEEAQWRTVFCELLQYSNADVFTSSFLIDANGEIMIKREVQEHATRIA